MVEDGRNGPSPQAAGSPGGDVFCPRFHRATELIGRRWSGVILRALMHDIGHFNDIKRAIPDLSPRMLSERLKELEQAGLVERHVIPTTPVRTSYQLTAMGRGLAPVFTEIDHWARNWLPLEPTG